MIQVRLTKFWDSAGILGKSVSIDPEDPSKLIKKATVSFADGRFETITSAWENFDTVLYDLRLNQALGMGVCKKRNGKVFLEKGRITVAAKEKSIGTKGCARTLENFTWHTEGCQFHNVMMIDIDEMPKKCTSLKASAEHILKTYPDLKGLPEGCWVSPSASAFIYDSNGKELKGLTGVHLYFAVPNTIPISKIKAYLHAQSWLKGKAYFKVNKTKLRVTLLERCLIDLAVFSPERLDFISGTNCGEGLQQKRISPEFIPLNGCLDESALFELSPEDSAEARRLQEVAKRAAQAELNEKKAVLWQETLASDSKISEYQFNRIAEGVLPLNHVFKLDTGQTIRGWDLTFNPELYHKASMYDPEYPEKGRCKAQFFYNADSARENRFQINAFPKGGRVFRIASDLEGVMEMLKQLPEAETKKLLAKNNTWNEVASLDPEDVKEFLKQVKSRGLGGIAEMRSRLKLVATPEERLEKRNILEEMNDKYAYVDVGNKPRILEVTESETILRTRNDFLTKTECIRIPILKGNKTVMTHAGQHWLEWHGRRTYDGIVFDPSVQEREFEKHGKKIFNRFRGFTVQPSAEKSCKMTRCNGKGCFDYFFNQSDCKICGSRNVKSNWTYWLSTIHECVCNTDLKHTKWVVDWLCDILQNPGGERPGTSLCIRGGQGIGKGSIIRPIQKILGAAALHFDSIEDITNRFNDVLEEAVLLFADEAVWGGSYKESSKLKRLITEDDMFIEPKGIGRYRIKNFLRLYISSNSTWVVPAEHDERRYTVFDMLPIHQQDRDWFKYIREGSLEEFLYEVLNWEITSEIQKNLETEALNMQKKQGWSVYEQFMDYAFEENLFWDEHGEPVPVSKSEVKTIYIENFGMNFRRGLAPSTFVSELERTLLGRGIPVVSKTALKVAGRTVSGIKILSRRNDAKRIFGYSR